jgi:hypothetical protein
MKTTETVALMAALFGLAALLAPSSAIGELPACPSGSPVPCDTSDQACSNVCNAEINASLRVNPFPNGVGTDTVVEQLEFTLPPGCSTGWHYHQGHLWLVVTSGTLTEDRGCGQPLIVHDTTQGPAPFTESPGVVHNVTNCGTTDVAIAYQGVGPSCTAGFQDLFVVQGPTCGADGQPECYVPAPGNTTLCDGTTDGHTNQLAPCGPEPVCDSDPPSAAVGAVQVTSDGTARGSPGSTVNAGDFTASSPSSNTWTISSVSVSFSDPQLFSSATLTAENGGSSETVTVTPPASSTVFAFSPPLSVAAGTSPRFNLTATIASPSAMIGSRQAVYASVLGVGEANSRRGPAGLGLLLGCFSILGGALSKVNKACRRRPAMVGAFAMFLFAAAAAGCGDRSSMGAMDTPSSTQAVSAISARDGDGAVSFTGLPATLGTITEE